MTPPKHGWTKPLRIANRAADPSGIQDASTELQAKLLSGMSTITPNIRYISLFTAAQYWRHNAVKSGYTISGFRKYIRRLEALIALSSVIHHMELYDIPNNIIGREFANSEVTKDFMKLETRLKRPPYNIYRGTLGNLNLFDLNARDDPLFDNAISIGQAWDIKAAKKLGGQIKQGLLPEGIKRKELENIAGAFCVCKVPLHSFEQQSLVNLLFRLDRPVDKPQFDGYSWNLEGARISSWRLLLELVSQSPHRKLSTHYMMGRILEPDILDMRINEILRIVFLLWRWIAARTLFELGWTIAFNQAFNVIKSKSYGIDHDELIKAVQKQYEFEQPSKRMNELMEQVKANYHSGDWLAEKFENVTLENCILLMICGVLISGEDINKSHLNILSLIDSTGEIPFNIERARIKEFVDDKKLASEYWRAIAVETLVHHTHISLRKMAQGNPDTQHVVYEEGHWIMPPGREGWNPRRATAFSRMDIALGWLSQLSLVNTKDDGSRSLSEYGVDIRKQWDKVYKSWASTS
ncbi:MAG: hypothetical protein PHU23_05370 [Dehalococcoidales bacterium]|nr:hypothetical protein [Dehalococcoidales bacterium]